MTSDLIDPGENFRDCAVRQRQGTAEIRGSGRPGPGVKPFSFFRMQGERPLRAAGSAEIGPETRELSQFQFATTSVFFLPFNYGFNWSHT